MMSKISKHRFRLTLWQVQLTLLPYSGGRRLSSTEVLQERTGKCKIRLQHQRQVVEDLVLEDVSSWKNTTSRMSGKYFFGDSENFKVGDP